MLDSTKDVLRKYVSDMTGIIRHVQEAIERQIEDDDAKKFPQAKVMLTSLSNELKMQRDHLDALGTEVDADERSGAKEAVTSVAGFMAGIYDRLRNHPISKDLRDDYVALTMCCVAYEMLHTTGLAVGHQPTADLTLRHLRQLTPYVSQIGQMIPEIVVSELAERGVHVEPTAAATASRNNAEAWSSSRTTV